MEKKSPIRHAINHQSVESEDNREYHDYKNHIKSIFPKDQYFHIFIGGGTNAAQTRANFENIFSNDLIKSLQDRKIRLLIDFSKESYSEMAEIIYEYFILEKKIPGSQITFLCSTIDYKPYIKQLANKLGQEEIKLVFSSYFERMAKNTYFSDVPGEITNPLILRNFDKKYINLNRRWKSHRLALLTLLEHKNLLDIGYNSFPLISECVDQAPLERKLFIKGFFVDTKKTKINNDMNDDMLYDILFEECLNNYPHIEDMLKNGYNVKNKLPLKVDSNHFADDQTKHMAYSSQRSLLKFARSSYFTVVTETNFDYPSFRFITEKTLKPIFYKHPFILVSSANSLERVRHLGYKTFDGLIDESYDKERDSSKRLKMIVDEIYRLSNLSENELNIFCDKLAPIVEHNFKVLKNKTNYIEHL